MRQPIRHTLGRSAIAVALLASAGLARGQSPVVIPAAADGAEGNSDNLYPLNGDPMRYQQVVSASEFKADGARWITRIAFRPDAAAGAAFSEALKDVQINLSTTRRSPAGMSRTFADNIGDDEVVAFRGELPLSSAFSGPASGPKDFDIVVTLKMPFLYDPAVGNLLLDVRNYSGGRTTQLDAHDAPDTTARIWSDQVDSPTATAKDPFPSAGLVMQFRSD